MKVFLGEVRYRNPEGKALRAFIHILAAHGDEALAKLQSWHKSEHPTSWQGSDGYITTELVVV